VVDDCTFLHVALIKLDSKSSPFYLISPFDS